MTPRAAEFHGGRSIITGALVIAAIGLVACFIGALVDVRQFLYSYLAAWACAVYLAVGALITLLTCHAMNAGWPTAVRRLLETMVAPFPLLLFLVIPILAGLSLIFPWVHPERVADEHARHVIEHKAGYLNPGFFVVRLLIYFAIWIALATLLRGWSFTQDRDREAHVKGRMYVLSGFALPVVAITITFSSFDWLMSLAKTWYSTMFPIYVFATGFVGAIALLTVLSYAAQRAGYLAELNTSHYYALGRLLLAFTIFWAYAAFFQFMLIWIANKPDEVTYFLDRWVGPWRATSSLLVFGRFIAPFILLMPYAIKRQPRRLAWMAVWILVATYVDVHWMVMPELRHTGFFPYHWIDIAALMLVFGLSVAFAMWRLRGRPIVPVHDPRLDEAFAYRSV